MRLNRSVVAACVLLSAVSSEACSSKANAESVGHDAGGARLPDARPARDDHADARDELGGDARDASPHDACVCKFKGVPGGDQICAACASRTTTNSDGSSCDWATEICNVGVSSDEVYATCLPKPCDAAVITAACFEPGGAPEENCGVWTTVAQP